MNPNTNSFKDVFFPLLEETEKMFWHYFAHRYHFKRVPPIIALVLAALNPLPAAAFKMKAHLVTANRAMNSIVHQNGEWQVSMDKMGTHFPILNDEAVEAIRFFPTYYRAGALGPDAFPDLIAGQLWTHVNKGAEFGVASDVLLENRPFNAWRSIDYGMALLDAAKHYYPSDSSNQHEAHLQALAFAYGYLSHMAADGFAHAWADDWARSVFSYSTGKGLYGPITEELQHISVEAFLDAHLRATDDEVRIDTPVDFLNSLFLNRLAVPGSAESIPPGAFAGPYYEELLTLRNKLQEMSHWENWTRGIEGPGGTVVRVSATTLEILTMPAGGIGNPIADIEDLFRRRSILVDGVLQRWVELSGCIAQNLARAGTRGAEQIIEEDACASIDFERGFQGDLRSLFKGSLNEAAHIPNRVLDKDGNPLKTPIRQREYDFGKTNANVTKLTTFLSTVITRALTFDLVNDIRTNRLIAEAIMNCSNLRIGPAICQNACERINELCEDAACIGCPKNGEQFSCWGGGSVWSSVARAAVCTHLPHCVACAGKATMIACSSADSAVAPFVCDACNGNPICKTLDATERVYNELNALLAQIAAQVIDPLVDAATKRILELYAGPYVNEFLQQYQALQEKKFEAKPAWFVNMAFLAEDLSVDPRHLERMLRNATGIAGLTLDNAGSVLAATERAVGVTAEPGSAALSGILMVDSGITYAQIWEGLIETFYRIMKDSSFDAVKDFQSADYAWLDGFRFRDPGGDYGTRLAKFSKLMSSLNLFMGIRGPTARALALELQLSSTNQDDSFEYVNESRFYVTHNATELIKLSFLSQDAVAIVTEGLPVGNGPAFRSRICRETPHLLCDTIQSLDDPNHYGYSMAPGSELFAWGGNIDAERSVATWESRPVQWNALTGRIGPARQCSAGVTDFLLASTPELVTNVYSRIFRGPEDCFVPLSDTSAAILTVVTGL